MKSDQDGYFVEVQSTPPLTEEELALWDGGLVPGVSLSRMSSAATIHAVRRLIAELRAAKERIKELEKQLSLFGHHQVRDFTA